MKQTVVSNFAVTLILTAFAYTSHHGALAEPAENGLVYDAQTQKYFVNGTSKFVLKPGDQKGLVAGIQVSLDGGEYHTYTGGVQFPNEGKHNLKFRALGPVNNWSPVQLVDVFVDLTPPSTTLAFQEGRFIKDAEEANLYVQQGSHITLTAQDNLSGVGSIQYSWSDSGFRPYSDPIPVPKSGKLSFYYRSIDRVGNTEPAKKIEFISSGVAPVTTLTHSGTVVSLKENEKSQLAASDNVHFTLVPKDDGAKIAHTWASIDEQPYAEYKEPISFSTEGIHHVKYYSEDRVGNHEDPKILSVYTVSKPPVTTATPVGPLVTVGNVNYVAKKFQLKLSAKDNAAGTERIETKLEGDKEFRRYRDPITFSEEGTYTVAYRSVDRTGNVEPTKTYSLTVEAAPPETKILSAQPTVTREGLLYSPSTNTLSLVPEKNRVGVAKTFVSINDGAYTEYAAPVAVNAEHKTFTVSYKSVDKLGNEEKPKTVTYQVLNAFPIVDLYVESGQNRADQVHTNVVDGESNKRETASEKKNKTR